MTASPDATPSAASPVAFLFAAWFVALSASLAVLFIGEVLGQTPCNLCWFQRAFMFPLAIILGVAAWRADLSIWRYAAPLAVLGGAVALYHSLLYAGIVPAPIVPCTASGLIRFCNKKMRYSPVSDGRGGELGNQVLRRLT